MNDLVQYGVYETLTPQQQDVHRDFVAARWESILGHLFDKSESPAARALTIADGVEVLKHYSTDEINEAWRQERARQIAAYGRLKDRVVPETLTTLIHSARPKPVLVKTEPAEKPRGERVSPEAMAAIRDEFGFSGLPYVPGSSLKPKPMQSAAKTQANVQEAQRLAKEWE